MSPAQRYVVQVEANLKWLVTRDAQTGMYMGVCQPLNLNAMGETQAEFTEAASQAIALLLLDLLEDGELDTFLRQHGWSLMNELPPPGKRPTFEVPFGIEITDDARELVAAGA